MTQFDKLLLRFKSLPSDFSWNDLKKLLEGLGFIEMATSKTGGSRRKFFNKNRNIIISLHKPHPSPNLKEYAIKQILVKLKEEELI
jgi:predicted RNA binding protein YcfA (HicA-like mRNA interferase family)